MVTDMVIFHLFLLRLVSLGFGEFVLKHTKDRFRYQKDFLACQIVVWKNLAVFTNGF